MQKIGAGEAKDAFGKIMDMIKTEPVMIERYGRPHAVVLSADEYAYYEELERRRLARKLQAVEERGFLGPEKSRKALERMLSDPDD